MSAQDLQTILNGAIKKGLVYVVDFFQYCKDHNLDTNAKKLEHFKA